MSGFFDKLQKSIEEDKKKQRGNFQQRAEAERQRRIEEEKRQARIARATGGKDAQPVNPTQKETASSKEAQDFRKALFADVYGGQQTRLADTGLRNPLTGDLLPSGMRQTPVIDTVKDGRLLRRDASIYEQQQQPMQNRLNAAEEERKKRERQQRILSGQMLPSSAKAAAANSRGLNTGLDKIANQSSELTAEGQLAVEQINQYAGPVMKNRNGDARNLTKMAQQRMENGDYAGAEKILRYAAEQSYDAAGHNDLQRWAESYKVPEVREEDQKVRAAADHVAELYGILKPEGWKNDAARQQMTQAVGGDVLKVLEQAYGVKLKGDDWATYMQELKTARAQRGADRDAAVAAMEDIKAGGNQYRLLSAAAQEAKETYGTAKDFGALSSRRDFRLPSAEDAIRYAQRKDSRLYTEGADGRAYNIYGEAVEDGNGYTNRGGVLEADNPVEDILGAYKAYRKGQLPQANTGTAEYDDAWSFLFSSLTTASLDYLSDDEEEMYYYILNKKGKDAALDYLNGIAPMTNYRQMQDNRQRVQELPDWALAVGSLASVPANFAGTVLSTIASIGQLGTGGNPYAKEFLIAELVSGVRGETAERIDEATGGANIFGFGAGDAYQSLMSGLDSAFGAGAAGVAYTLLMGSGAASAEARRLQEMGASDDQVILGALSAGAAETVFEYVSIDHLVHMEDSKTVREAIKNALVQGGIEASEEVFTEISNMITNQLIMASRSDYNMGVLQIMQEQGVSRAEAEAQYVMSALYEAGMGGFLSGAAMAGPTVSMSLAERTERQERAQAILDGRDSDTGSVAYQAYLRAATMSGVSSDDTDSTALKKIEKLLKHEDKAVSRYSKEAERWIRSAEGTTERISAGWLSADTAQTDARDIMMAYAEAKTGEELRQVAKLAQVVQPQIDNAKALGLVDAEDAAIYKGAMQEIVENCTRDISIMIDQKAVPHQRESISEIIKKIESAVLVHHDEQVQQTEQPGEAAHETEAETLPEAAQEMPAEAQEMPAEAGETMTEVEDDGTVSADDGAQWQEGVDSAEAARAVAAEPAEQRPAAEGRRGEARRIYAEVERQAPERSSSKSLSIEGGTDNATMRVVPDSIVEAHESLRKIREEGKQIGATVRFYTGDLEIAAEDGSIHRAEGLWQRADDGSVTMWVKADGSVRDAGQIYRHEEYHQMVAADPFLMAELVWEFGQRYGEEEIYRMIAEYGQAYAWKYGKITEDMDPDEELRVAYKYLEEMYADAYAELRRGRIDNRNAREIIGERGERLGQSRENAAAMARRGDGTADAADQRYSALDNEYMEALANNDMDEAQRLVDEAAREAMPNTKIVDANGNLMPVYHGTTNQFWKFDTSANGGVNGTKEGFGIYTSADKSVTEYYGDRQLKMYANIEKPARADRKTLTKAGLTRLIKDTCVREAQRLVDDGDHDNVREAMKDTWVSNYADTYGMSMEAAYREAAGMIFEGADSDMELIQEVMSGMGIRKYAEANDFYEKSMTPITGFDGFVTEWRNKETGEQSEIVLALRSEQLKSADPVTYDDEGNVIPLSERFNHENTDIRYSFEDDVQELNERFADAAEVEHREPEAAEVAQDIIDQAKRDADAKLRQKVERMTQKQLQNAIKHTRETIHDLETTIKTMEDIGGDTEQAERALQFQQDYIKRLREAQARSAQRQIRSTQTGQEGSTWYNGGKKEAEAKAKSMDIPQLQKAIDETNEAIKQTAAAARTLKRQGIEHDLATDKVKELRETLAIQKKELARKQRIQKNEVRKAQQEDAKKQNATMAASQLQGEVASLFNVPGYRRREIYQLVASYTDELMQRGTLSQYDRDELFTRLFEAGVVTYDSDTMFKGVREYMTKGRIYVPQSVRADFGDDWADFRKRAWGNRIYLTDNLADKGADVWMGELAELFPGAFSDTLDERVMLEQIVDLAESGKAEKLTLQEMIQRQAQEQGYDEDEQIEDFRRKLDGLLDKFVKAAEIEVRVKAEAAAKVANAKYEGQLKADKARIAGGARIIEQRQRMLEAKEMQRQRRMDSLAKDKLLKSVKKLERLGKKTSPEYQARIKEVLGDIDTVARALTPSGIENLQDLAEAYMDAAQNPNFIEDPVIEDRIARLRKTQINDLDASEVRMLAQDVSALVTAIENQNKMLTAAKKEHIDEMAKGALREIEATEGGDRSEIERFFTQSQVRPTTFLKHISGYVRGGYMQSLIDGLEDGQRRQLQYAQGAHAIFKDFFESKEAKEWLKTADKEWISLALPTGETIEITPMMRVSLMMHAKNNDNLRHIAEGGITIPEKKAYSQGKIADAYSRGQRVSISKSTMQAIAADATPMEQRFARLLTQYFDDYSAKRINEVSLRVDGFERAGMKNYFHIKVDRSFLQDVPEAVKRDLSVGNTGSVVNHRKKAKNPVVLEAASTALTDHIESIAKYVGLTEIMHDFNGVRNYIQFGREQTADGEVNTKWGTSIKETVAKKWGNEANAYIDKLMADMQGGATTENDPIGRALAKIRGNLAGASLRFNPKVALSQTASLPGAWRVVGLDGLAASLKPQTVDEDLIAKYSPLLDFRHNGGFSAELTEMMGDKSLEKRLPMLMDWIGKMDAWAIRRIWTAAEHRVQKDMGLKPGSQQMIDAGEDRYYQEVAKIFDRAVMDTQPNYTALQRPQILRTTNELTKAMTMYKTVPLQYYNELFEAAGQLKADARRYKNNPSEANRKNLAWAKKNMATAAGGVLAANAVYVAMGAIIKSLTFRGKGYKDEDDEYTFGSVLSQMGKELMETYAGSVIFGSELMSGVEYLIKMAKGESARYYGPEASAVAALTDTVEAFGALWKDIGNKGWAEGIKSIKDLAKQLSMELGGIPAGNIETYLLALTKWLAPEWAERYTNFFDEIEKGDLKGEYKRLLPGAIETLMDNRTGGLEDATYDELTRMWAEGYYSAIPSAAPTSVSVDGENIKLTADQRAAYREAWAETVAGALDKLLESQAYKSADDDQRAAYIKMLYDLAGDVGKAAAVEGAALDGWKAAAMEGRDIGIPLEQFIVFRDELMGIDSLDENGEAQNGLAEKRKIELLERTGWDAQQQKTVYQSSIASESANELMDELTAAGLSYDQCTTIKQISGSTGRSAALLAMDLPEATKLAGLEICGTDKIRAAARAGSEYRVDLAIFGRALQEANTDGKGGISQEEAKDYIDGLAISVAEKAYFWQMLTNGKEGKKNPYSSRLGKDFYDAMAIYMPGENPT